MPPIEKAHKCSMCGSEILIDIGTAGRWNSLDHTGGPSQRPMGTIGIHWAFYRCAECGFEGPWKKQYMVGSKELNAQYKQILEECKTRFTRRRVIEDKLEKIEGIIDAQKTLSSLPGSTNFEHAISEATEPLLERIIELESELSKLQAELQKRKGGRPKLSEDERKKRKREREASRRARKKAEQEAIDNGNTEG